jgi:BMFP domain-containing protein YqiC
MGWHLNLFSSSASRGRKKYNVRIIHTMLKPEFLKKLAEELAGSLPSHLQTVKKDLEKNCQLVLNKAFSKLELVTREEFDVQAKVLARTRKKLEELEEILTALEKKKLK